MQKMELKHVRISNRFVYRENVPNERVLGFDSIDIFWDVTYEQNGKKHQLTLQDTMKDLTGGCRYRSVEFA